MLLTVYLLLLALIGVYGAHRYWLLRLYRRSRRRHTRPMGYFRGDLPRVTMQLPMFNEPAVARRVIDAACAIDYPRDRLQIQVLDDSTDGCAAIARARVAYWADRGLDIHYLHRADRAGYKAGALRDALPHATGGLIAIFDADFIPPRNFLRRTVHYFTAPRIGMVQARWSHLNRDDSLLTRAQAIFLDGHFLIEHAARNRSGAWMNFNGTAGVWRRAAIESAGGWQHDTLTEDVDLSYRAQLAGWQFVFLPRLRCPAELPPHINAFRGQQHRWTKGSIQVAMKLLPTLLRAPLPMRVKAEAFFHLTCPMVYLFVTMLALLLYPAMTAAGDWGGREWLAAAIGPLCLTLGTVSALLFYVASQTAQRRSAWLTILQAPPLMAIGVGIALSNAVGCIEALLRHESPFVRTPKYNRGGFPPPPPPARGERLGEGGTRGGYQDGNRPIALHRAIQDPSPPVGTSVRPSPTPPLRRRGRQRFDRRCLCVVEIAMGLYMLACASLALTVSHAFTAVPFLLLFAAGYLYVGISSAWDHPGAWRHICSTTPMPSRSRPFRSVRAVRLLSRKRPARVASSGAVSTGQAS